MTRLTILEYPDPRLRTRARPVTQFDATLRRLIDDMFETMYAAPGVGLAAPQVDFHQRLMVMDVSEEKDTPLVFINPEILLRGDPCMSEEGCLSVPGYYEPVQRASTVRVRAQDRDGKTFELDSDGLLAVCVQHEMDHLEGKLFVDYISELKRSRIRKKLEKDHRQRTGASARAPSSAR
jgi:peptide deformylase